MTSHLFLEIISIESNAAFMSFKISYLPQNNPLNEKHTVI